MLRLPCTVYCVLPRTSCHVACPTPCRSRRRVAAYSFAFKREIVGIPSTFDCCTRVRLAPQLVSCIMCTHPHNWAAVRDLRSHSPAPPASPSLRLSYLRKHKNLLSTVTVGIPFTGQLPSFHSRNREEFEQSQLKYPLRELI